MEQVMSDMIKKTNTRTFKKRAHRPWKPDLLESTVQETSLTDEDLFSFDLDLTEATNNEVNNSLYPEFNFTDDIPEFNEDMPEFNFNTSINDDEETLELKKEIQQTKKQHEHLIEQINDKSNNAILLGGFFQPQHISANTESMPGRKINSLLSDLKVREQKLNTLTNSLKISEANERAEQAELSKQATTQQLFVTEQRMRKAIQQAKVAEEQFAAAIEQAKQAAIAQQEEAQLRAAAEASIKEAQLKASTAETALENEQTAHKQTQEKLQHASATAAEAHTLQLKLADITAQLERCEAVKKTEEARRLEIQQQYDEVNNAFFKLEQEHKQCAQHIYKLEEAVKDITKKYEENDKIAKSFTMQTDKLKSITTAEQDLRKIAERKYHEAQERAHKAEQGLQIEVQKRKSIEERAKHIVAHANRTVMHLLNSSTDNNAQESTQTTKIAEYDYKDEDLLF